jgi:hypothetical protein
MTEDIELAARIIARRFGWAIPIRRTSVLAPDPHNVFLICPIRVVAEQRVQAIAFGPPDGAPQIVVSINPLSRESMSLEPFAEALDDYFRAVMEDYDTFWGESAADGTTEPMFDDAREAELATLLPRVWVANGTALEVLELLGHRYRTNVNASPILRRMGWLCRIITEEAQYAGQQVVAVATRVLTQHVATGQSRHDDQHLAALLTWIDPSPGVDPVEEADRRALVPAAAMLERHVDDRVEGLRRRAKGRGADATRAEAEIRSLLEQSARAEWAVLNEAREAFWRLGLPPIVGVDRLVQASRKRVIETVRTPLNPPTQPHSLSKLLEEYEFAVDLTEDVDVRGDALARWAARQGGRAFSAEVIAVDQPRPGRHPCSIVLRTRQDILRIRREARLKNVAGTVEGVLIEEYEDAADGSRVLRLRLTKGVQRAACPRVGVQYEWTDTAYQDHRFKRRQIYNDMRDVRHSLVYGDSLPAPVPRRLPPDNLFEISEGLKKS